MLSDFDKSLKPIDDMIIQLKKEGRSVDAIHCSKKYFEKVAKIVGDFITVGKGKIDIEKTSVIHYSGIPCYLNINESEWYIISGTSIYTAPIYKLLKNPVNSITATVQINNEIDKKLDELEYIMDSVLQNEARNYAINRRAENYDVESDLCELTNGFPADYVQEIEKSVEEARTEAFVAGAKFILNKYEKK